MLEIYARDGYLRANQERKKNPTDGLDWLSYLAALEKAIWIFQLHTCIFLKSPNEVNLKNDVDFWKDFLYTAMLSSQIVV